MTDRQELFCREYVVDYNGTRAAQRAGYSEKTAYSMACALLKKPEVLDQIRRLQAEQVERLSITSDYVLLRLVETLERCMQARPVTEWDAGEGKRRETGVYTFDSKGALRALELIGRHIGMWQQEMKVTASVDTGKLDSILSQLRG